MDELKRLKEAIVAEESKAEDLEILLEHRVDSLRLKIRHLKELTDDLEVVAERKRQQAKANQALRDLNASLAAIKQKYSS